MVRVISAHPIFLASAGRLHVSTNTSESSCHVFFRSRLQETNRCHPRLGVDADGLLASQVFADYFVGDRVENTSLAIDLLLVLRAARQNGIPVPLAGGAIRPSPFLRAPPFGINIVAAPEERPEQSNLCWIIGKGAELSKFQRRPAGMPRVPEQCSIRAGSNVSPGGPLDRVLPRAVAGLLRAHLLIDGEDHAHPAAWSYP